MKLNGWIYHTLFGFAVFNLIIGITLVFSHPKLPYVVISPAIPQVFWAIIFIVMAIGMFYALFTRNWRLLRLFMICGLVIKSMWEISFIFRIQRGATVLSAELWGMIAYLQALGVVYFNPEDPNVQLR